MPSGSVSVTADYGAAISFSASPAAGGSPACASGANPCWVDYGGTGNIRPFTNTGYTFSSWSGGCYSGSTADTAVTVTAPCSETASYTGGGSTTTVSSGGSATCPSSAGTDTCNGSTGIFYETGASASECSTGIQKISTSCYISGGTYYYTVGYSDGGTEKASDFCGAYSPSNAC